jgi:L-fucose mutarotase
MSRPPPLTSQALVLARCPLDLYMLKLRQSLRINIMLKGISPLLGPELLYELYRMGHGDTIILGDAHFPGESLNPNIVRADGLRIAPLLEAILPLLVLDPYVEDPVVMMAPVEGDTQDKSVVRAYREAIDAFYPDTPAVRFIDRYEFYEEAERAFSIVMTGETAKYGNILLTKGVTPSE